MEYGDMYANKVTTEAAADAVAMQQRCAAVRITTHNEFIASSDILKDIKGRAKRLEELRREMTRPLDDSKQKIMDFFRIPSDALAAAEKSVKAAILQYTRQRDRERDAELARLSREREAAAAVAEAEALAMAESGDMDAALELMGVVADVEAAPVKVAVAPRVDGIGTRKVWKWRLLDFNSVPYKYLKLDDSAIGNAVRTASGQITIPGIEVYCDEIITSRG
jgi:hypothetical protein